MKRKLLVPLAGLAATSLLLMGCGQGTQPSTPSSPDSSSSSDSSTPDAEPAEPVEITFQSLAGQPATIAATDEIVAEWNAANPDIQVKIVPAGWDGIYDKLVAQFNGGAAPDIIHFEASGILPFATDGYIADLTDYISPELRGDINEGVWESVTVDGEIIAYPTMLQSYMVFANLDLLEAAGVEVPDGETMSWDELRAIAKATTTDDAFGLGWGLKSPTATVMSLALGFDGGFFEGTGTDVSLDVGAGELAAIEKIHAMAYEDLSLDPVSLTQSGSEVLPSFYGEKIALTVQGSFQATNIGNDAPEGFNWTVLPPLEGTVGAAQAANPQTFSVNIDSEHVAEATKFLEFIVNSQNLAKLSFADALIPSSASAREALGEMTAEATGWDQVLKSGNYLAAPPFLQVDLFQQWKDTVATPGFQKYLGNEIDIEGLKSELITGWDQINR